MATVQDVAHDFTALLRQGQFEAAGEKYWADDVTSIEPDDLSAGKATVVLGIEALRAKTKGRLGASRIEDICIDGPFVTGKQFALFLDMMIINRSSGEGQTFCEIALYTVRDGQITEERYFHD